MNPESSRQRFIQNWVVPALVTCAPLGMMLAWRARNTVLPYWDDAGYMEMTVRLYDAAAVRGLRGLAEGFLHVSATREPMIAAQALPAMALLGRTIEAAKLTNGVFVILFCVYLYRLCRLYWPWPVGAAAALLAAGSPLLTEMMNAWLREYPLTALLTMTAFYLAASDGLRKRREGVILGALLGVTLLYRALYPLYAAGLYAWALAPRLRDKGEWRRLAADLAVVAGIGAVIAGPWFAVNWRGTLSHMLAATRGIVALDYGSANVFDWVVIRDYLSHVARQGVSTWTLIAAGIGVAGSAAALARGRLRRDELAPAGAWGMLAGWGAPFIVFLFGVNKELRFITPMLPAAAVAAAALLWGASRAARGAWMAAAPAAALGVVLLAWGKFGPTMGGPALGRVRATLTGGIVIRRPEIDRWPHARIVRYLDEQAPRRGKETAGVMMLSDTVHYNPDLLQLWATLERKRMTVTSSIRLRHSEASLRAAFAGAAVVAAKEGGEADLPMKNPGPELLAEALRQGRLVELARPEIELPDGGRLRVWRRK